MAGFDNDNMNARGMRLEPSTSQDYTIMQKNNGVGFISGTGSPEGVVNANPASAFYSRDTGNWWRKETGTGNTGWVLSPTTDLYTAQYIVDATDPNGSNFTTIQDAIDQAILDGATTSSPGTLICVRPGTYAGFTTSGANFITITSLASAFEIGIPVIVNTGITCAASSTVSIQNINCTDTITNNSTLGKLEGCSVTTLTNNVSGLYLNSCLISTFTVGAGAGFVAYNSEVVTCTIGAVTTFALIGCNFTNTTINASATGTCYFSRVETSSVDRLNGCWVTGRNTYNSNTGTGDSGFVPMVHSASSSDPFINWRVVGVTDWIAGIDNSDTDAWVLARGTALGTTNALKFDTSGNLYLPGQTGIIGANGASAATASAVTNHATLVGAASNGITSLALGTAGQVLTSNGAGADPSYQSPAFVNETWTEVTGTSQAAAVNNGYVANNAGLVTITLPATAAIGQFVHVLGKGAGLWSLVANTGQTIRYGTQSTSTGGSLTATSRYHAVRVRCITANTEWIEDGTVQGNLTVA